MAIQGALRVEERESGAVVLVVDDDSASLLLARRLLGAQYRVAAALSGEAALRYLEGHTPDLILMDVNMPGLDGLETARRLRRLERCRDVPVVFLTGDGDEETARACRRAGAADVLVKPLLPSALLAGVARALKKGAPVL